MPESRGPLDRLRASLPRGSSFRLRTPEADVEREMDALVAHLATKERDAYREQCIAMEREITRSLAALERAERLLADELAARDRRLRELEDAQDDWERRLAALAREGR